MSPPNQKNNTRKARNESDDPLTFPTDSTTHDRFYFWPIDQLNDAARRPIKGPSLADLFCVRRVGKRRPDKRRIQSAVTNDDRIFDTELQRIAVLSVGK